MTPVVAQIDLPSKAVISENGSLTGLKISRTEVDSVFVKKVAELHNKVNCRAYVLQKFFYLVGIRKLEVSFPNCRLRRFRFG